MLIAEPTTVAMVHQLMWLLCLGVVGLGLLAMGLEVVLYIIRRLISSVKRLKLGNNKQCRYCEDLNDNY